MEAMPLPGPTTQQSSTIAVCLKRQNTSKPYSFGNSPLGPSKKGKGQERINLEVEGNMKKVKSQISAISIFR